ncbi:MAG: methionyl-tRNA formyltransferase [Phycisphaera sp.]|nr:methionyl-tRNA formyltransferase [Phycisphaera sp.]
MRLVFLGAGAFGIPSLDALAQDHEVALVVTQPDRPAGRGKVLTPTPIAVRAAELGIRVVKPPDVNAASVVEEIRGIGADAWVVIAFGQKLSRELVDGVFAINLHGSVLPAYRGAAPIQRAVMDGCAETGVSVIGIAERMDAGLVYATRSRAIGATETADEVHDALALLGPEVLSAVLADHAAGRAKGEVQDESKATRARKLSKAEATVDLASLEAHAVRARINGLNSWPGCTVLVGELPVKILRVAACRDGEGAAAEASCGALCADGTVRTLTGAVRLLEVQPVGGKAMTAAAFLNGRPALIGAPVRPLPASAS